MTGRDLDAAGVEGDDLRASYARCRALLAEHGRTYHLATLLLPPGKRPYVWALYGFARYADEIVDDLGSTLSPLQKADALGAWGDAFLVDLARGRASDPVYAATVHTARRWEIPAEHFEAFLASMRMDLTVTQYPTFADLERYVHGSASVIGLQMVPVLEPLSPAMAGPAAAHAQELGVAFQLVNFVRDVGEDLARGRVYLPLDELAEHGVTRADLERRVVTPAVRSALAAQVDRVRALAARSAAGVAMLHPSSRPCVDAARVLYCGIADAVEAADYQVFDRRARVGVPRRAAVAGAAWARAVAARRRHGPGRVRGPAG